MRRRVLDALRQRRGVDVPIAALYAAGWPDEPLPESTADRQRRLTPVVAVLRRAGWRVDLGDARRSYRLA